jgi:hypothetical protein
MAKCWISLPLVTASDPKDESVVSFLKGGTKKDLEVEVAAFITKWLMDKDVPFGIDFDSCAVDRALVIESLPKRLQKVLGITTAAPAEPGEVAPGDEGGAAERTTDIAETVQAADSGVFENVAEAPEVGEEIPHGGCLTDGPSGPR